MNKINVFIALLFLTVLSPAQELLTPGKAVEIALTNNFIVKVEKNKAAIARLENHPGEAGMLPRISAGVTAAGALDTVMSHTAGNPTTGYSDKSTNVSPSVTLSWTLFDGMRMFAEKSRLRRLQEIGELNYKDTLQTFAAQTLTAYYDIVSAQQQMKGLEQAIGLFRERLKIAQKQFEVGTVSKVDFLQAQLDLNEQKSAALAQQNVITQKRVVLNILLARPPETDFSVVDSIPVLASPPVEQWDELARNNLELISGSKSVEAARFARNEAYSLFLPSLNISAGYGLDRTSNTAGSSLLNQVWGPSAGLALSIPIFNGFVNKHALSIANLNLENSQIATASAELQIRSKYYQARKDFETASADLKLEEDNIAFADENVKIAMARFRLAQSTAIEMRTAELSYVDAITRLVAARFNAKSAETELLRIQGKLVK